MILRLILILAALAVRLTDEMYCVEEMNYHMDFGYGYDITCKNLNRSSISELEDIMVYNEIKLNISNSDLSQLHMDAFKNIPKLKEIVISHSMLNLSSWAENSVFSNVKDILVLALKDDNINMFPNSLLRELKDLKVLDLEYNRIESLPNTTFEGISNLHELNLNNNYFYSLEQIPFNEIATITNLSLTNNRLAAVNKHLNCLNALKYLHLDYNDISIIENLQELKYLEEITLTNNNIVSLSNVFNGLKFLRTVKLNYNKISSLDPLTFNTLENLEEIDLGNNLIKSIPINLFSSNKKIRVIDLQRNLFNTISIMDLPLLEDLNLSGNSLSTSILNYISDLPRLTSLQLQNCSLKRLGDYMFKNFTSLTDLNLSENTVVLQYYTFYGLTNLRKLSLKINSIIQLPDFAFIFLTDLNRLDLSKNNIIALNNEIFKPLKNLTVLNLSYNKLQILEETVLDPLTNLKVLNLEGNKLKTIDYDLILSDKYSLKLINIKNNMFYCDFLKKMLLYFLHTKVNFTESSNLIYTDENVGGVSCVENKPPLDTELLVNDTAILKELYKKSSENETDIFSLVLTMLAIVMIVLVALLYIAYVHIKRRPYLHSFELRYADLASQECC